MLLRADILTPADGEVVAVDNGGGRGAVLLVCEHASNRLPARAGDLGLSREALESHIAWDPGALAVARLMASRLDAVLISQRFSRLIYDCNRPPESPSAMPETSEIYEIPGNHELDVAERYARTAALYVPFHDRISSEIEARLARGQQTVLVTVHSFTPVYLGAHRAVEIGILHDADSRLADGMLLAADGRRDYVFGRNDPYGPDDGVTHTLKLHAQPRGLLNVMIEVRNDLIGDEAGQLKAAECLVDLLQSALSEVAR